jgi:hypothetical protein
MPRKTRDYETEFIQAFEELGWNVVDCVEYAGDLPVFLATEPEERTVFYQYTPCLVYNDTGKKSRFSLDFAVPGVMVYMEFDGFFSSRGGKQVNTSGHRNWGGFHRDRRKDRTLVYHGWRGYRFGPGDVRNYAGIVKAARQFIELVERVRGGRVPTSSGRSDAGDNLPCLAVASGGGL